MTRKLFALVSVTALGGLVSAAGCGGLADDTASSSDASADASVDVKSPREAAPDDAEIGWDPGPDCKTPIDATQFPYTKAVSAAGACTTKELEDLSAFYKSKSEAKQDVKITEWSAVVSASCSACVFGDGTGAEWTPILVDAAKDELDNVNRGGCVELLSGKETCGRAYQQAYECRLEFCLGPCSRDEFTQCLSDTGSAVIGPCKTAYATLQQECGANVGAYEAGCKGSAWTFEGPIKVQCITGGASPGDAGKDAN